MHKPIWMARWTIEARNLPYIWKYLKRIVAPLWCSFHMAQWPSQHTVVQFLKKYCAWWYLIKNVITFLRRQFTIFYVWPFLVFYDNFQGVDLPGRESNVLSLCCKHVWSLTLMILSNFVQHFHTGYVQFRYKITIQFLNIWEWFGGFLLVYVVTTE